VVTQPWLGPGWDPSGDLTAIQQEGVLTIRGERHPDPAFRQDQLLRLERRYGPFHRSLNLPSIVDPEGVRASYRDGVLEIRLPKRPEATPRVISVEAA